MALVEDMAGFFDIEGFAVSATYTPADASPASQVQCIINHDVSRMGSDTSLMMYHTEILLRKDQVAVPKRGDSINDTLKVYKVRGLITDDGQVVTVAVD